MTTNPSFLAPPASRCARSAPSYIATAALACATAGAVQASASSTNNLLVIPADCFQRCARLQEGTLRLVRLVHARLQTMLRERFGEPLAHLGLLVGVVDLIAAHPPADPGLGH